MIPNLLSFTDEMQKIANVGKILHDSVEGFMGGLKALPKGSAERGRFITDHMSHGPFVGALKAHPQGETMHKQLTGFLNSKANAGLQAGVKAKVASNLVSALEVGGLGVLARPSMHTLRKKGATGEEKSHAKHELAGLGILAAHPTYELGKAALQKARKIKIGQVSMQQAHAMHDAFKAAKGVAPAAQKAAPKLSQQAQAVRNSTFQHFTPRAEGPMPVVKGKLIHT